jgi:hypothetical protein
MVPVPAEEGRWRTESPQIDKITGGGQGADEGEEGEGETTEWWRRISVTICCAMRGKVSGPIDEEEEREEGEEGEEGEGRGPDERRILSQV